MVGEWYGRVIGPWLLYQVEPSANGCKSCARPQRTRALGRVSMAVLATVAFRVRGVPDGGWGDPSPRGWFAPAAVRLALNGYFGADRIP